MIAVIIAILAVLISPMFFSKRLDVAGKSLAEELVRRGAHVVIVARDAKRSAATVEGLKALAKPSQKIFAVSADLMSKDAGDRALTNACELVGALPDYVFLCAGFSKPQLFIDASCDDLQQLWVKNRVSGTLTFVSSFLGYTSFAGYSPYAPGKYALRGLADSLRSELQLYGIKVHLYMPAGILSPGYENEQKTKPAITKKIEEGDTPIAPEKAAGLLIRGIERGEYQITNDLVTDLVRSVSRGPVPSNGPLDYVYGLIAAVGLPIWRRITDAQVRSARPEVYKQLEERGFFN
ncbi:oxidoreductase [Trichosporon asahii var. asahii CBS 8904]|uniref:Oxidoreductase n=1 Tax=Trichosporon asahii var. asahii (strain CBS 8904) TaxID=1220162 RepID=K1VPR7_TRIAC|nr:oxidoreductase [Trichosporon asahii var. asahii CBS 8904]